LIFEIDALSALPETFVGTWKSRFKPDGSYKPGKKFIDILVKE